MINITYPGVSSKIVTSVRFCNKTPSIFIYFGNANTVEVQK